MKTFPAITLMLVCGVQAVLCVDGNESLSNSSSWMYLWGTAVVVGIFGLFLFCLKDDPTVEIQENYTVTMGEKVELTWSASAFPFIKSVSWQHILPEGQTIPLDIDQQKYAKSKQRTHLIIKKTLKSDEGEYVCTVSDWCGRRRSATTEVMVEGGPPKLNINPPIHKKTEGDDVVLQCKVVATPSPSTATWTKTGDPNSIAIDDDKYFMGSLPSPALIINNMNKIQDEGEYTCEARNIAGPGRNSVHLIIDSKTSNPITRKTTDIERNASTEEDMVHTGILLIHRNMVVRLAKYFFPTARYWKEFLTGVGLYLYPLELEGDLYDIVANLLRMKYIEYGQYMKLYDIVNEIEVAASHIIEVAELKIKEMRESGTYVSNETPAELCLKCKGNLSPKLPDHLMSDVTGQFPDVEGRLAVNAGQGSIVLTFTISEAKTPHQLSALYLAVTLGTRLQNGKILLTDESHVPLILKTTPTVRIPTDNSKDILTVRLSRRHYQFEEGKDAILKCVVVGPLETRYIKWFTVKDDGNFHDIFIDNKKYFCGSPKSPSLVISDLNKEDRGIYFCRVGHTEGEEESNMAVVEINVTDDVSTVKESVSTMKENVSTVKEDVSTVKEDVSTVKEDVSTVKEPVSIVKEDVSIVKEDVSTVKEDVSTVKEDVSTVKEDVSTVKKDVGTVKEDVSIVKEDVSTVKEPVSTMKEDVSTVKEDVSIVKEDVSIVKEDVSTVKEDVSTVKEDVGTVKGDVSTVKEDVSTVKEDVSTVKGDVSTVKEDVSTVKEDVSTVKEDVCTMKGDVSTVKEDVSTVKGDVSTVKGGVSTLKGDVSTVKEDVSTVKEDVGTVKEDVSIVKEEVSTVKKDVSIVKEDVSTVKKDVSTMKGDVSTVKEDVSTVKEDVSTVKEDVSTLKGDVSTLKEDVSIVKEDVSTVKEDVSTVKEDVSSVKDDVSTVKEDVSTVKEDVSTVKEDVSTVNEDVSTVKEDVSTVKEDVSTVKKDVSTVKGDVSTMKEDVSTVKEDVSTVKRDVSTVKDKFSYINPKLAGLIETTEYMITEEKQSYNFMPTKSLEDARAKLLKNRIVIIKGNSGDGKTSIALELLRLLCNGEEEGQQKQCRRPLELHEMKDLDLVKPNTQLVIYLDDLFGKSVVCEEDVKEWEKRKRNVLPKLCGNDPTKANFLVITIRSGILNSVNIDSSENIFTEQNIVDLKSYIDVTEKLKMLTLYEPKEKFMSWTDVEKRDIVSSAPDIGFPQCCRMFRDTTALHTERVKFFRKPFDFMKNKLWEFKDGKFYALLYMFLNGGKVVEHDLEPNNENIDKTLLEAAFAVDVVKVTPTLELVYNKGRKLEFVKESLECLLGWLVKKESIQKQSYGEYYPGYKFNHDSIEETVALLYGEKFPIGYIQNCPVKSLSYVTTSKTTPNRIVISSDGQTNAMYKRLVREFESLYSDRYRRYWYDRYRPITSLDVWTDTQFLQGFIRWLSGQNVDKNLCHQIKLELLNEACSSGAEECALYLLSEGVEPDKKTLFCVVKGGSVNVLKNIVKYLNDEIKLELLNKACSSGAEECALCLLSEGVEPDKETPFCVVKGGSVNLLHKLLEYDVTPTARAERSRSSYYTYNINVLHEACLCEREEMVTVLCDKYPHLVHDTAMFGRSTLHLVAQTGNCGIFHTVERTVRKSLCRVEDEQHKCETVDGRVVHRSCVCAQYMSQLVNDWGETVLHLSCWWGHRELMLYICESFPALTTVVDEDGCHCLHLIARCTTDVDLFTECETHVKRYLESTGREYDITAILNNRGQSVLDSTKYSWRVNNPLYDHLVRLFSKH